MNNFQKTLQILKEEVERPEKTDEINQEIAYLKGLSKNELISKFPSTLSKEHLKSEPKENIISAIMSSKYRGKVLQQYFDYANSKDGRKEKLKTY